MKAEILEEKKREIETIDALYQQILTYALEHGWSNTPAILATARDIMFDREEEVFPVKRYAFRHFYYSMVIGKMIIDLNLPEPEAEYDRYIAAALGHVLGEILQSDRWEVLEPFMPVDRETKDVIFRLIRHLKDREDSEKQYYSRVREDRRSMLVRMVEMAILTEHFFEIPLQEVEKYVRLTREYYFPMAIYGKEHYVELSLVISVLMEKVKLLMDVTEILSRRHRDREIAMINEILVLEEENARIRVSIRELEEESRQEGKA